MNKIKLISSLVLLFCVYQTVHQTYNGNVETASIFAVGAILACWVETFKDGDNYD